MDKVPEDGDGPSIVEAIFKDLKSCRAGLIKALTIDVDEFLRQCDPDFVHFVSGFVIQIFWFGDLNYRLNMSDAEVRKFVAQKQWNKLIRSDQLRRELASGHVFDGWKEGLINFAPVRHQLRYIC
ncbi:hypothetical protein QQ045_031695 [Rhodiola kirilowii]